MQLKVLHLISSPYGLGGAEKLLLDMAGFYDADRFSVHYCNLFGSPKKKNLFSESLVENELPRFDVAGHRLRDVPSIISRLRRLIVSEGIDIVQTHLVHAALLGGIVGKLSGKHKTIVTQHYTQKAINKFLPKKIDRAAVKLADRIIAVSSAVKSDLLAQGAEENKIRVIHNGINVEQFDRAADAENDLLADLKKRGKYIIGSVGNLHKRKDHATLVRAMGKVVEKFPEAHLVIVGEGTERADLEKLAAESKLTQSVTLAGFQANVPALIKDFDLYAHSAKAEPFGIAILEGMAARKGVVAAETEGVVDIIENEQTGFLIPPQNPQAMADYICRAIENPRLMAQMGARGRRRVENSFTIENTAEAYQKLYEEIA